MRLDIFLAVLAFELVMGLVAQWEVYQNRYGSVLPVAMGLHFRLLGWVFMRVGGLVFTLARAVFVVVIESERVVALVEAAGARFWRLHGRLEDRLIVADVRLRRSLPIRHKKFIAIIPPTCHMPLAVLPMGMGSISRTDDGNSSSGDPSLAQSGVGCAMGSWHGRAVSIILGLVAGLVVAGIIWLAGLYRLPGATGHALAGLGGVRLVIGACILAGLGLGAFAHHAAESAGPTGDGFARSRDIRRAVSAGAVRRSAAVTRPGVAAKRLPVTHSGTFLGWRKGRKLWASLKDVILLIAPPQTGKTAYLGGRIIDACGPVVATSTKADIYVHTVALRADRGPVWVFNPEALGHIPSNFRWSPLEGCADPEVASQRAGYLLAGIEKGGGENAVFWREMNAKLLRCLLLAAAISGRDMRDVWAWINDSADPTPLRLMEADPLVPRSWVSELEQLLNDTPERTRQSVYLTLAQAMQFVTSPAIATAICPAPGEATFSLEAFLAGDETLYLLGSDQPYASLVPLFTAITGHVFDGAKQLAGKVPNGRLDPPLTLALDEAALICPVPLQSWTADSGGRGIQLLIAVQSPSQLFERWGQRGGETIYNNANAKLIFGGLGHGPDLEHLSKVCGERDDRVHGTTTGNGGHRSSSMSIRRIPVLAPHEIRQIPDGMALVLYRNMAPVLLKIEKVWERKDVKAAARRRLGVVQLRRPEVVEAPAETPVERRDRQVAELGNVVAMPVRRGTEDETLKEAAAGGDD